MCLHSAVLSTTDYWQYKAQQFEKSHYSLRFQHALVWQHRKQHKKLLTHLFYSDEILTNGKSNVKILLVSNVHKVSLQMLSKMSNVSGPLNFDKREQKECFETIWTKAELILYQYTLYINYS